MFLRSTMHVGGTRVAEPAIREYLERPIVKRGPHRAHRAPDGLLDLTEQGVDLSQPVSHVMPPFRAESAVFLPGTFSYPVSYSMLTGTTGAEPLGCRRPQGAFLLRAPRDVT